MMAPRVEIKVGVLRIGDIYMTTINGDVYTDIGLRIKQQSPAAKTMVVTIANGFTSGNQYIYSDAASHQLTFQIISSSLKPGCAEEKIVSTALDLIHQAQ
jgi:neutral ceramidase